MKICSLASSVPYKKNPFLGPDLLCFANPGKPEEAPASQEAQGERGGQIFEDFKEIVPGTLYDPEKRWEVQQHWIQMVGDYDGIQNQINHLLEQRKKLLDDKLFNTKQWRKQYEGFLGQHYKEMLEVCAKFPGIARTGLLKTLREEAFDKTKQERGKAVAETDELIRGLLAERKEKAAELSRVMRQNLTERLMHLKKQWKENPPPAYLDYQDHWVTYCDRLIETLKKQDLSRLDNGDPKFPQNVELYKDAKKWWDMVSMFEDSYTDFSQLHDPSAIDDKALKAKFEELKHEVGKLEPDILGVFEEKSKEFIAAAAKARPKIEAKYKEAKAKAIAEARSHGGDAKHAQEAENAESKFWKEQLGDLDKKIKELEEHKHIKEMIEAAFYSKEPVLGEDGRPATVPGPSGPVNVPMGIEAQLEFLKSNGLSHEARRAAGRTMLEGMRQVKENIMGYKNFAEVHLVESMNNLTLFEEQLMEGTGVPDTEIILMNPFQTLGSFWESFSKTLKENVDTQQHRAAGYWQENATKILMDIPAPLNELSVFKSMTELSPNGRQSAEHAEHGRVGEIEKAYEGFNTEHLMHLAAECNDRWEFKACLNLLAKRGRVDFYAPWLFKQLNRWQKTIRIPETPYFHQKNLTGSDEMLRQAFIYIYRDAEGYKTLKNSNQSAYESKMGEFSKNWGGIAAQKGALKREAEKILEQYESDHHSGVHFSTADPIKFESIIRYAVDQGKMKAEDRLNLLVRGIASGLLPFDRGVNATDKNNTYPPFDWFDAESTTAGRPTIDDIKALAEYAKDPVAWDFKFHKDITYNDMVYQRLDKTITQGSHRVDHDDAPMLAGYLQVSTVRDMLTQKTSGGYGMPITGLLSLSTGNEFWLDMYSELYDSRDMGQNNLEIVRFATQFLMYEGILNRKVYKDQVNLFRLEPDKAAQKPRTTGNYAKVFGREEKGTGDLLKGVAKHLTALDFDPDNALLTRIFNNDIRTDDDATRIAQNLEHKYGIFKGAPPVGINKLYDALPEYLGFAVKQGGLQKMVTKVRSEHKQNMTQILSSADAAAERVRAAAAQRAQGIEDAHGHGGGHGGGHGESHGEHPAEGHDDGSSHGSTPVGGGPSSSGSTHGGGH